MQPPYKYRAFVYNVVDGDTFDARVDLGFTVSVDIQFRLAGVDTPEITSRDPVVREVAQQAKRFVADRLLNKTVMLESFKVDKFGRWLADVFVDDKTISQLLIENNLGAPYFGGAKFTN